MVSEEQRAAGHGTARAAGREETQRRYRKVYAMRATAALGVGACVFAAVIFIMGGADTLVFRFDLAVGLLLLGGAAVATLTTPSTAFKTDAYRPEAMPPGTPPDPEIAYSIIIPVYNRPDDLRALLGRINELTPEWQRCGRGEIVVVDDGSKDDTAEVGRQLARDMILPTRVIVQQNKSVSGARNRGFLEARGKVGIVIDSDCLPGPGWVPTMLDAMPADGRTFVFSHIWSDRFARFPIEISPAGAIYTGASFAARVPDYLELGGNYERFNGAYLDDVDLVLSAQEYGFETIYAEGSRVWHPVRDHYPKRIWFSGRCHRFDGLLALRHGLRAQRYFGNKYLGGSWFGSFPSSVLMLVAAVNLIVSLIALVTGDGTADLAVTFKIIVAGIILFLAGATAVALYFRSKLDEVPRYVVGLGTFTLAAFYGRLQGLRINRIALF